MKHRCGYATFIGRPNAGKSTLLNTWLGSKLAITSPKPQTTRDRVVGIWSAEGVQAVLCDTPGVHAGWNELNQVMVRKATMALADADVVLWLEDMTVLAANEKANRPLFDEQAQLVIERLQQIGKPILFLANKMDLVPPMIALPAIDAARKAVKIETAIPISARTGLGLIDLQNTVTRLLPEGPPHFPRDQWTEATERFLVGESIREKIFLLTEQEIPYATAVVVEDFDESDRTDGPKGIVRIRATILVERATQKGILIGKGGEMLKRIGTQARQDIVKLLDSRVHLELFVKVEPDWSRTTQGLRRVGFALDER